MDFIVDLQSKTNRGHVATHSALYEGKYAMTAEEVCSELIYKEHDSLHHQSNILEFYGRKKFQKHSFFVFGEFEPTLSDFISSGNVAEHPNVYGWILSSENLCVIMLSASKAVILALTLLTTSS
ncbi:hypothetical protein Tco_1127192 [Tanacetum coccineum]